MAYLCVGSSIDFEGNLLDITGNGRMAYEPDHAFAPTALQVQLAQVRFIPYLECSRSNIQFT